MFNTFKKVLNGSKITIEDANKVQPFILLRWLSGDARLQPLLQQLNQLKELPDNLTLLQSIQSVLKGQIRFIKYPKIEKLELAADKEADLNRLQKYFDLGYNEAVDYWDSMTEEQLTTLRLMYKDSM